MQQKVSVFVVIIVIILNLACGVPKQNINKPLRFVNRYGHVTSDTIHEYLEEHPFSIELLGKSVEVISERLYKIQYQIGIYGSNAFKIAELQLFPDSVEIDIWGVKPIKAISSFRLPYEGNPWDAYSLHLAVFDVQELMKTMIMKDSVLHFKINLNKYAIYNNNPVSITPILGIDPWFRTKIVEK